MTSVTTVPCGRWLRRCLSALAFERSLTICVAVVVVLVVGRGSTAAALLPLLIGCAACVAALLTVAPCSVYGHEATA